MSDTRARIVTSLMPHFEALVNRMHARLSPLCKSPIEELLGVALATSLILARPQVSKVFSIGPHPDATISLIPQFRWRNYTIDFALVFPALTPPHIFIECDGHDFHERTKEQAAHDRRKDRAIQTAGIPVLRFTGSEIFRDPGACADQIAHAVRGRFALLGVEFL